MSVDYLGYNTINIDSYTPRLASCRKCPFRSSEWRSAEERRAAAIVLPQHRCGYELDGLCHGHIDAMQQEPKP